MPEAREWIREELLNNLNEAHDYITKLEAENRELKAIAEAKGVDAVEVVRCKDCKFSKAYYHGPESNLGMFTYLCTWGLCMNADDYCSKAERKEE